LFHAYLPSKAPAASFKLKLKAQVANRSFKLGFDGGVGAIFFLYFLTVPLNFLLFYTAQR
jgi:hypothetical protein